jgi:hypothetical protein
MCVLLWWVGKNGPAVVANPTAAQGLEYKDFIAILLTAIGVMIAIAALLIAMLAIWGFEAGKKLLLESTKAAAVSHVDKIVPQMVDAMVPQLVEDKLRFERKAGQTGDADAIAESYRERPDE